MSSTGVSVLLPLAGTTGQDEPVYHSITRYLESTGFDFEIVSLRPRNGEGYGALLRRGASEARGDVLVLADPDLPYGVGAIGDAVAMIESGSTDVVFGMTGSDGPANNYFLRWLLVDILPDPKVAFKAFSAAAARLVVAESRLAGAECALEIAFLANRYGFRVEPLHVEVAGLAARTAAFSNLSLGAVTRIRMTARRMGYRAPRRCLVCFANDVWTAAQIPGNLVRACSRCRSRYLNQFPDDESEPVRRELRPHSEATEPQLEPHSSTAREKTSARRLAALRKHLAPRARLLEIGIRDGSFGVAASQELDYVGIDSSSPVVRAARARGLDVYCATPSTFVNTGPSFDAIALFHIFENLPDPHDALARIKDLLKPGGVLLLTTFDTEGLLYAVTERKRVAHAFRTHLFLYSRSAMIELLEHSGFEIDGIGPDFEHRDHRFLRHLFSTRWPSLFPLVSAVLRILPDPLLVGTGSIRIIARRRSGSSSNARTIRSAEATHAR